ncbi:MAG TPA: c-type cytochrome [Solirubrobacterales bacterium]
MDNETLFYLCGGVLAVSAIIVTFVGLKSDKFPGRALPLIVVWFAVFVVGAATFAVRYSVEHQEHNEHKLEHANEEIEADEGDDANSEEAEAHEEGSQEEEPVGPTNAGEASGGDPAAGETVFAENCAGCHGEDGHGGPGGPDLTTMPLAQTEDGAIQQVTNGGGGMPPFGEQLSEEEISNVAAYVVQNVVGK